MYKQLNINGKRFYLDTTTGRKVPSVTTIINQNSPFKGKPGASAAIGSLIHYHILKNYDPDLKFPTGDIWGVRDVDVDAKIESGLRMWQSIGPATYLEDAHIEDTIFTGEYAGRVDAWGYDRDGIRVVNEIKTGNFYPYYLLQGSAYARALDADYVRFIWLDVDSRSDRNPEQIGRILIQDRESIDEYFVEFVSLLEEFNEHA